MNSQLDALGGSQKRVEDKLEYHDILLKNQKWEYSAPHPSDEYWITLDENEVEEAEDFLSHIKRCTEEMRYGRGNGEIEINADISYNEAFLPHWEEFSSALEQYHYHLKHSTEQKDNAKLHLYNIKIPENVINLLSKALKSTYFQNVLLSNNNFGQKGIDFVLDYLKSNVECKDLVLNHNPFNGMKDIERLCDVIEAHPSIENLALGNCIRDDIDGYEMLKIIMNAGKSRLVVIGLCNNNISTGGDTFISDFLATNPILETLDLSWKNQLNDQDAISIAKALKQNTKLDFLDLTTNRITKTGWKALRKAEFDDSSLNAAADSNHTCAIKYPPDGSKAIERVDTSEMNGNRSCETIFGSKFVRQKKIYSVLSLRNRDFSNVKHFEDVPVETLPYMLQSIQEYSNYRDGGADISQVRGHVNPLSIVYEICRNWEDSLAVFESLSSCG